ncbi:MAG TPA: ABC transporter substrate-binding protein [Streptosporangiaceae bacterium]
MIRKKTGIYPVVATCVAALALAACGSSGSSSASSTGSGTGTSKTLTTVKVGYIAGAVTSAPFMAPQAFGFFAKHGIKVDLVSTATVQAADQLLGTGQLQFAFADVNQIAAARSNGLDMRLVANAEKTPYALMCQKSLNITGSYPAVVKKLIGHSVGISNAGSLLDSFLRYTLISAGVKQSSVNIVSLGSLGDMEAGLKAKKVDCVMAYQPMQGDLASDANIVVNYQTGSGPATLASVSGIVTASSESYVSSHPAVVKEFLAAYQEGINLLNDPSQTSAVAQKLASYITGTPEPQLADLMKALLGNWLFYVTPQTITAPETIAKAVYGTGSSLGVDDVIATQVKSIIFKQ